MEIGFKNNDWEAFERKGVVNPFLSIAVQPQTLDRFKKMCAQIATPELENDTHIQNIPFVLAWLLSVNVSKTQWWSETRKITFL